MVAILDLAKLVERDTLPCSVMVPSELSPIVYAHLGRPRLTAEALRSGNFYDRS